MDRVADPILRRLRTELVPRLQALYGPARVILFGSRARGDALDDSDVDLIVVSDRFDGMPFLDRAVHFLDALDPPFGVDVLCYTPARVRAQARGAGHRVAGGRGGD